MFCSRHLKLIYFPCGVYQKPFVHVAFVFGDLDIGLERIGWSIFNRCGSEAFDICCFRFLNELDDLFFSHRNIERLGVPIIGIRLVDYSLTALFFFLAIYQRASQFCRIKAICDRFYMYFRSGRWGCGVCVGIILMEPSRSLWGNLWRLLWYALHD